VADTIPFDHSRPEPGRLEEVSPLIRRWVNPNPGPFTFTGTCTYVIGRGRVAVVDPGPERPGAAEELLEALGRETVSNILVTHTHRDHSPGAKTLKTLTGARTAGCGPHRAARDLGLNEHNILDASADMDFRADLEMTDGDVLAGPGWTLTALATPGHTMNHLCFAFAEENTLIAGDHVMAWSTTIVAPPDGSMSAYMASLDKLRERDETIYWPGHGGPVTDPKRFLRAIIGHRKMRENAIVEQLREGAQTIPALVEKMYMGLAPNLKGAAALSVFAHLEDLVARGTAGCEDQPTLDATYYAI
jgi:glyoxylase-like metal-dependent hydrolase (beta-lactamase superfamily II)